MKRLVLGLWPCVAIFLIFCGCSHVQLSSFSIHVEKGKDPRELRKLLGDSPRCKEDAVESIRGCYRLVSDSRDGSRYELIPMELTTVSAGQAFDEAYRIQGETKAQYVEPLFEIQMPRGIEKGDFFAGCHDPEAANDAQWNLKQIRAQEAWLEFPKTAHGQEAKDILIAHIDTGYTEHPEIWQEVSGRPIVYVEKGRNYYDANVNPKPLDPLSRSYLLDFPGHGTGSASVIVSPEGCQLQGEGNKCPTGVGRGAQIAPLRVGTSVIQFNTRNIARAIRDVAEETDKDKPQIVSIAMGGPPTHTLRTAVESAEQNGVLIVAASGNYVRIVVWPAGFPSAIAVAATNVRCEPWKFSSHGQAVDISAPGESVWRAQWKKDQQGKNVPISGMSKGTTFATGNTAGAAALWMVWHEKDIKKLMDDGKKNLITRAFRNALWDSAWRPKAGSNPPETHCNNSPWDDGNYGNGILNVYNLLKVPFDVTASHRDTEQGPASLPLFSSLYPATKRGKGYDGQVKDDYRSLFSVRRVKEDPSTLSRFETEIMYHYTMNEAVQQNLDAVVQGNRMKAEDTRKALLDQNLSKELRRYLTE